MTPRRVLDRRPEDDAPNKLKAEPSRARTNLGLPLAGYVIAFALLALPWLRRLGEGVPRTSSPYDAQLIIWILAWVARALRVDPTHLFDGNINYPAPHQLTGSEHLLSTQLVFAPLAWMTGNAVIAAGLTTLVLYVLAALAMQQLLRRFGCGAAIAWFVGLDYAIGPAGAMLNLQSLQYPTVWLPAVALCLAALRERPDLARASLLAGTLVAGVLSSYYGAVLLGIVALVWSVFEALRPGRGRGRFLSLAAAAALIAGAVLAIAARPYVARGAAEPPHPVTTANAIETLRYLVSELLGNAVAWRQPVLCVHALLVLTAFVGFALDVPLARRVVLPGIVLHWIGWLLTFGYPMSLGALLAASPLRFFRISRFVMVAAFGTSLLVATGLDSIRRWARPAIGGALIAASIALLVGPRLVAHARLPIYTLDAYAGDASTYDAVAAIARAEGEGALLELPLAKRPPGRPRAEIESFEPKAMLGSTRHWLPLVSGYTGYQPPHRKLFLETVHLLPDAQALDDLIDMTHLRWVLVRPARDWSTPEEREAMLERLAALPAVGRATEIDGWVLYQIVREPAHPEWFRAIAAGFVPGHSVLGTPLEPLRPDARAIVRPAGAAALTARPKQAMRVAIEIENGGTDTWPAAIAPLRALTLNLGEIGHEAPRRYAVRLAMCWLDPSGVAGPAFGHEIRRDLQPGEVIRQEVGVVAPATPGEHELEVAVEQIGGTRLDAVGGGTPLRLPVRVESPAS